MDRGGHFQRVRDALAVRVDGIGVVDVGLADHRLDYRRRDELRRLVADGQERDLEREAGFAQVGEAKRGRSTGRAAGKTERAELRVEADDSSVFGIDDGLRKTSGGLN